MAQLENNIAREILMMRGFPRDLELCRESPTFEELCRDEGIWEQKYRLASKGQPRPPGVTWFEAYASLGDRPNYRYTYTPKSLLPSTFPGVEEDQEILLSAWEDHYGELSVDFLRQTYRPVPVPTRSYPIDPNLLQTWIDSQCTEETRQTANWIASQLRHISFSEFLQNLENSIMDFNHQLVELGSPAYAIILGTSLGEAGYRREPKSNLWVSRLAFPILEQEPRRIEYDASRARSSITHFVIIDDASYSGNQIFQTLLFNIQRLLPTWFLDDPMTFHLVIPYMTQHAQDLIRQEVTERFPGVVNLIFYTQEILPTFREITIREWVEQGVSEEEALAEYKILAAEFGIPSVSDAEPSVIYFDHKLPDSYSTLYWALKGALAIGRSKEFPYCGKHRTIQTGPFFPFIEGCVDVDPKTDCPHPPYKR